MGKKKEFLLLDSNGKTDVLQWNTYHHPFNECWVCEFREYRDAPNLVALVYGLTEEDCRARAGLVLTSLQTFEETK